MISRERVQQVQLARFLVADYGYRFARSMDKAEEIWLVNGRARQFPVVRISSFPLSEAYLDKSRILHLNRLWEQEQQLTQALLKNRDIMLQGMFQQLLKETE